VYNHNAYNLGICSALPLPELQPSAEATADVTILFGSLDWSPPPQAIASEELYIEVLPDEAYFFWRQLGKFRVARGTEIIIDPLPNVEERLLRLPLLGTIFAVLLHQRGRLVLHASAVAIDGEAIIFVGNKGRGKSTMAATLYGRGHQLISDDVVALEIDEAGQPIVIPGFPQFKLYPEAALLCLGDDPEELPELVDGYEKRSRRVADGFVQDPSPLRNIYVLGRGPVSRIEPLDQQTSLLTLIANSYVARFGKQLLQGAEASTHLRQCTALLAKVSVYRLDRPDSLALLPSTAQMVEGHCQSDLISSNRHAFSLIQ
jgi:hypothetical protein